MSPLHKEMESFDEESSVLLEKLVQSFDSLSHPAALSPSTVFWLDHSSPIDLDFQILDAMMNLIDLDRTPRCTDEGPRRPDPSLPSR
ncbi:MAG: hypothetical protein KDC45_15905 [Bacteroidetes bacterium]|nr:hypothetical protein [Bacteroidota bacterium]